MFFYKRLFFFLGMFAIRADRDYVIQEDFIRATRKIAENKKLEGSLDYEKI
jgi:26S proteasome regulatory subunit T4